MLRRKIESKKGDVTDMLIFLIIAFIMAIGIFVLVFTTNEISDGLRSGGLNNTVEGGDAIDELQEFGNTTLQAGFFLLFVGLIISTLITSFFIRTHPLFMFLYIFVLGLTVFIGTYLSNAYETMINSPIFANELASQTLITLVMENMITILVAVGALSMIIVFSKFSSRGRGVGGQLP